MSWIFGRKKEQEREIATAASEVFSSPGMAIVSERLLRRPGSPVLELGAPSTESLAFLAKNGHDVEVVDLYHSSLPARTSSPRGLLPPASQLPLPEGEARFEVILMWDLLHYLDPADRRPFGARLAALAKPGAMVFALAASSREIPAAPIHFRIEAADRLRYAGLFSGEKLPPPRLGARDVEQAMLSFSAERIFQLRNGFQEIVLERNS
jgi:hypothetical protein